MIAFRQIAGVVMLITFFAGVGVFGILAAFHVDPQKLRGASLLTRIDRWGPLVPASILTEKGKRFALYRDASLLICTIVAIVAGIVLSIARV